MITLQVLEKMPSGKRACDDALKWFSKEFPNGAELRTAWEKCEMAEWKVWFACNYNTAIFKRLAWKFAGQAFRFAAQRHPQLKRFADNVSAANWCYARSVAANAYANAYASADADDANAAAYAADDAAYADNADDANAAAATANAAAYAAYAAYADNAADDYVYAARSEQVHWCEQELFQ